MNILLIGSGAREHAIARAFSRSVKRPRLFCCGANYNAGIARLAVDYQVLNPLQHSAILTQAKSWRIDLVFIGTEGPLALGLVDLLAQHGIASIGPTQQLAQVETSKIFARTLLAEVVPRSAPRFKCIDDLSAASSFLHELGDGRFVIKPDGLTAGKGVKVAGDHLHHIDDALAYCQHLLTQKRPLLIEEKLDGNEFSLHCFVDGSHCSFMPAVKDFKRAYCGDKGPNTGSMGSISDANHRLPFLSEEQMQQAQHISQTLIEALQTKYHTPYKGILYGSFMSTEAGIKLIEFNARFGDPEAINILALLECDLVSIVEDIVDGALGRTLINFSSMATVCKYAVPQGYPTQPLTNAVFEVDKVMNQEQLYFANHRYVNGSYYTTSSRTVAVLGIGNSIAEAEEIAETEIMRLTGPLFHRADIGLESSYASMALS